MGDIADRTDGPGFLDDGRPKSVNIILDVYHVSSFFLSVVNSMAEDWNAHRLSALRFYVNLAT